MSYNLLRILFNKGFSQLIGFLADLKLPKVFLNFIIKIYVRFYKIDILLYEKDYDSFNDFFSRKLKNKRNFDQNKDILISPSDGFITQFGKIEENVLLQAKKKNYKLENLIKDNEKAKSFYNGQFLSIHLTPSNYHRFHCPVDAKIKGYTYIKGGVFPVNAFGRNNIDDLYAKNERLITYFDAEEYEFIMIFVGAFVVGKIAMNHFVYSCSDSGTFMEISNAPFVQKGELLGRFLMGSSIILLFPPIELELSEGLKIGRRIKFGDNIGVT